jgi:hypothetical protein
MPLGAFWVDANTVNRMTGYGSSFAVSLETGFPARALDFRF